MDMRDEIIEQVATKEAERICRKVIRYLRGIKEGLSGDDSGLANVWDEICVQVQGEQSVYWDAYEDIVHRAIEHEVNNLPVYLQQALWLQTDVAVDWLDDDSGDGPWCVDDIVHHIANRHVFSQAADASNRRIETFFRREYELGWD